MTAINIDQLEHWKETSNQRQHIICHVVTLCTSDNECLAVVANLIGVVEREIAHFVETQTEDLDRDTKP